jgi:pimeloyl-ACP methyl ester carboxylesterase
MKLRTGLIGGALGLVATTAAVAVAVDRAAAARRRVVASGGAEKFADPPVDRNGVIAAEDGTGLYYEEVGPLAAPLTVVFVHGFALNLRSFFFQRRAIAAELGDRVRMVFFDQRAHGRSDQSSPERASIDQLGRDLATVLSTVAPYGPIVLVGHSMGGMTILALADQHPELFTRRVRGVALMSTSTGKLAAVTLGLPALLARVKGPLLPLVLRNARSHPGLVERGRALGGDVAWAITRKLSFATEDIDPAIVNFVTSMIAATRIEVIADYYPALMQHDKLAALDALAGTRVLIACGDHDLLTPPAHSREMAERLPDAELVIVADAGHVALIEQPKPTNDAVIRLIEDALAEIGVPRGRRRR